MKRSAFILSAIITTFACNQSEEKEVGTYEPPNTPAKVDSTSATASTPTVPPPNANAPAPDTARQKVVEVVKNESLQNFWVLETVDGKALNKDDFPNGTPYFEINLKKNKISGHAGCNSMNGSIKVEGNNIVFGDLSTTKATCSAQEFENKYLNALSGHKVPYKIEGINLYLTGGPGKVYVYRKIQQ